MWLPFPRLARNCVSRVSRHSAHKKTACTQKTLSTTSSLRWRVRRLGNVRHFCTSSASVPSSSISPPNNGVPFSHMAQGKHIHPVILAGMLLETIEKAPPDEIKHRKSQISDFIEKIARIDIGYTTKVLYKVLRELGHKEVAMLMRGALNHNQVVEVLAGMAHNDDWRESSVMDLMVDLLKNSETSDMKMLVQLLPKMPISSTPREPVPESEPEPELEPEPTDNSEATDEPTSNKEEEIDYFHPSAFWGYRKRVRQLDRIEMYRQRVMSDIPGEDDKGVMLTMPYKPHSAEWFPDEIGVLIGRMLADEWELDHITYLLIDIALHMSDNPSSHAWQDYLGYVGIILGSAMSVERHWENEDIMWVYKDFCHDVGKWALYTWSDFREMEYREFLADVICIVANRRGDAAHDTKLISLIMDETCEEWDYERSDYLGYMIESRMRQNSFPHLQIDKCLSFLTGGRRKALSSEVQGRSLLWSPPETYYLLDKWMDEHRRRELLAAESQTKSITHPQQDKETKST